MGLVYRIIMIKFSYRIFKIVVATFLFSCSQVAEVRFTNENSAVLDSVIIYADKSCEPLVFRNVKKGDKKSGFIPFCNEIVGDGTYGIEIFKNGKVIYQGGFGYYSNGKSLNESFKIMYGEFGSLSVE